MKKRVFILLAFVLFFQSNLFSQAKENNKIIVITTDGFRWQELFKGLDTAILKYKFYQNGDSLSTVDSFGGSTAEESRKKLLPFFWSTIAEKGQIHGKIMPIHIGFLIRAIVKF